MATTDPIDPSDYVHAPVLSVSSGITLAKALVAACPDGSEPAIKKARKHLQKVADDALAQLAAQTNAGGTTNEETARDVDHDADRAWSALRKRLVAMALLDSYTPKAARAHAIEAQLFHGSLMFLKTEYSVQRTRMEALLKTIEDEGLASEIDSLCGAEFLAACRDVQPRYTKMVNARMQGDPTSGQTILETVRALQGAIVHYASKVVGTLDLEDPASHERVRAALHPIDAYREASRKRAHSAAVTPAPVVAPPLPPNDPKAAS